MQVTLMGHTPDTEKAIVDAAAVSYRSKPREEILEHIIKAGHLTPTEFAVFNFKIEGISRACSHQLVRKRVGVAFVQESQRHVEQNGFRFVVPKTIAAKFKAWEKYSDFMVDVSNLYEYLVACGVPKEDARFILPAACTTTIAMTANYHTLLDLAKERLCSTAQWEIRAMVDAMKSEVEKVSPKLAGYLQPKCYWLKHCPEKGGPCSNYSGGPNR